MTWLVDDPGLLYFFLGLAAFGCLVGLWMTRRGKYLIGFVLALAFIGVVWLVGVVFETDAKRISKKVDALVAGVNAQSPDQIFANVSEQFQLGGMGKADFRRWSERYVNSGEVQGVTTWDFEVRELSRPKKKAVVIFKVKSRGLDQSRNVPFYNCRCVFVLDSDDQWRLQTFDLFLPTADPMGGNALPLPPPM